MKKSIKVILIVIGVLLGIILLDTLQAVIFKQSPFISWKENLEDNDSWVDKGIFMDTYYCTKEKDMITVSWKIKGSKFTCPIDNDNIDELNNINNKIIEYFSSSNVEYDNYSFNYVDEENKVVVVGLLDNSKEQQDKFRKVVFDSEFIKFIQGEQATITNDTIEGQWIADGTQIKTIIDMENGQPVYADDYDKPYYLEINKNGTYHLNLNNENNQTEKGKYSITANKIIFNPENYEGFIWSCTLNGDELHCENYATVFIKNK